MKIWRKQFLEKTQSSLLRLALSVTIDIDIEIDIAYRSLLSIQLADILSVKEPGEERQLRMTCNLPKLLVHPRDALRPRDHRNQQVSIGAGFGRPGLQSIIAVPMVLLKFLTAPAACRRRWQTGTANRASLFQAHQPLQSL